MTDGDLWRRRERINASTRLYVVILGTLIGLAGMAHGVFEVLQGDRTTGGWLLSGIGAVTLIGNFRLTGIAAIIIGLGVIAWTFLGVHRRHGPVVLLGLSLMLVLVGGGVAILPAAVFAFAVATRIASPLAWWGGVLPANARPRLASAWLPSLLSGLCVLLAGIAFWLVVLPPGATRPVGPLQYLLWSVLLAGVALMIAALVCGLARDIELAS